MNQEVLDQLVRLHEAGRLAHAYLFAGPTGIGKFATALALAQRVNCLKATRDPSACGCDSCRKIAGGNHPDMLILEKPEDKTGISVDQVRGLIERLEFRSLEAKVKFAIVKDADLFNEAAANAFLKTLEEPRLGTVLILTTAVPDALLSTVRSRCQLVRFAGMSAKLMAGSLKNEQGLSADEAVILAAFGQGSPGRAMELGRDFMDRRQRILDVFFMPGDTEGFVKLVGVDRNSAYEALGIILMALRDALFIKSGAGGAVVNRDRQVEIKRFAERCSPQELSGHVDRVTDAIRRLDGNQNVKVVLTVVREML
ncbi:MAG: DNA polymerase III subunit delta' [Candidatus Omnitrophica bacterium]|nr:DNA polymerase III subunit delta' [Candidatus Omnitrophota bacterium]